MVLYYKTFAALSNCNQEGLSRYTATEKLFLRAKVVVFETVHKGSDKGSN